MTISNLREPIAISTEHERQRVEHLVLQRARPAPDLPRKPIGMSKQEWKVEKQRLRDEGHKLLPGIEEAVARRERWAFRKGTPETHEHADDAQKRPGSLARLYASKAIDDDQLAAADEIVQAHRLITADVSVRTASLEARVDSSGHGRAEAEALGRVYADFAYDWWRAAIGTAADMLLAVIVYDTGLTIAARRHGMSMPRARRTLSEALDLWWVGRGRTKPAARIAAEL